MTISKQPRTLNLTVTSLIYPREVFPDGQQKWCIMNTTVGRVVGMMPFCPKHGMKLRVEGSYQEYQGRLEFKITSVKHDAPEDSFELLKYVGSLAKGVGDVAVQKIYMEYKNEWRDHLDDMPQKWGIPLRRSLDILESDQTRMDVLKYILSKGGTPRIAELVFAKWRKDVIPTITANPYSMTQIDGIGFKTVDAMREKFGIGDRDMKRAMAAVDYVLNALLNDSGNSIVDRDDLYKSIRELDIPSDITETALAKLVLSNRIVMVGMDKVTTARVVKEESDLAEYAARHVYDEKDDSVWVDFNANEFVPDESQREAISAAVRGRGLVVINGGAGCGKTKCIKVIARELERLGSSVKLCAFAGKAAARIREATGHGASTIHSMLGYTGEGYGFSVGDLHGQTIIMDEASMVPSSLMYEITSRDPERLILVGDQAQLQPVGIGSPFHDVIDALPTVVHTLKTCYRNKEAVFSSAQKVRDGFVPHNCTSRNESFSIVSSRSSDEVQNAIVDLVNAGEIDFHCDLVLSPRNGEGSDPEAATVKAINDAIQSILNPHKPGERFREGDRVMCTKNAPKYDIWNGTCGWITHVDQSGKPYFKSDDSEGASKLITDKDVLKSFVPAYCLTVHKSQGSQYRNVHIVCLKRDDARMMDRSMLYTAITRAKNNCTIYADSGIERAVNAVRRRVTYLQMKLKGED